MSPGGEFGLEAPGLDQVSGHPGKVAPEAVVNARFGETESKRFDYQIDGLERLDHVEPDDVAHIVVGCVDIEREGSRGAKPHPGPEARLRIGRQDTRDRSHRIGRGNQTEHLPPARPALLGRGIQ